MAAAASAPPPPTSHTIESTRPAGLGGPAATQPALPGSKRQPAPCQGPPGSTEFWGQAILAKMAPSGAPGRQTQSDKHLPEHTTSAWLRRNGQQAPAQPK